MRPPLTHGSLAYYNDRNPKCCQVLLRNIRRGCLYPGIVDSTDIRQVDAEQLKQFRQIHLFAGIGGFPLGFIWAGLPAECSILTGGFPCQPFSSAGRRKGTADSRYLWPAMFEVIRVVRSEWLAIENVDDLVTERYEPVLERIYADLESASYESLPPLVVPACAFGAWHRRDRVWIIANLDRERLFRADVYAGPGPEGKGAADACGPSSITTNADFSKERRRNGRDNRQAGQFPRNLNWQFAESKSQRNGWQHRASQVPATDADSDKAGRQITQRRAKITEFLGYRTPKHRDWWATEPPVGRVVHGLSNRLDKASVEMCGEAIVPQIAEWIARRIKQVIEQSERGGE